MDKAGAARLTFISAIAAFLLISSVHALIIGIPAFSPSYECNSLFSPSSSASASNGAIIVNGASYSSFQSFMSTYGLSFNVPGGVIALSCIALMVSFLVIAIAYALGKILPASNISNWLQKEYWEIIKSAVLIAIVFLVISLVSSIGLILNGSATTVAGAYPSSIQSLALYSENYLCTVNNQANLSISNFAPYLFDVSLVKSISISYGGIPIPPLLEYGPVFRSSIQDAYIFYQSFLVGVNIIYLGPLSSIFMDFVMFLVVPVMVFYSSQVVLLPFLIFLGLAVLFPIGLVMRSLPLLRGVGGTLIAFAIGIAVIWPSILILFNAPVSSWFCSVVGTNLCMPLGPVSISYSAQLTNSALAYCQNPQKVPQGFMSTACSSIMNTIGNVFNSPTGSSIANNVQGVSSVIGYIPLAIESGSNVIPAINMLVQYNLYLVMQFYILGVLDLMILYAFTDNIAKMLGGSIRLGIGRKLKLV